MDRISTYRVARLALHIPVQAGSLAPFSVVAIGTRRGVPHASILVDGRVACPPHNPTTEEILEAMDAAIRQCMI